MQVAFGGGLGQNTPDGEVGGVCLHGDGKVRLEVVEDWSCRESCLQLLEGFLGLPGPDELMFYEKCKGDRLNARKWIWNMEWMVNASYMSFIERVNNESTRYMY